MKSIEQLIAEDKNISPQLKSVMLMTAITFGRATPRKVHELIEDIIASANHIELMLGQIAAKDPHANILEAQDMAQGILLNVAGYRKEIEESYEPEVDLLPNPIGGYGRATGNGV